MKNAAIRRSSQLLGISTSWKMTKNSISWSKIILTSWKSEFQSHEIRPPDHSPSRGKGVFGLVKIWIFDFRVLMHQHSLNLLADALNYFPSIFLHPKKDIRRNKPQFYYCECRLMKSLIMFTFSLCDQFYKDPCDILE